MPPCFDWKRHCFAGLKPQNRGHSQVPGIYISDLLGNVLARGVSCQKINHIWDCMSFIAGVAMAMHCLENFHIAKTAKVWLLVCAFMRKSRLNIFNPSFSTADMCSLSI